MQILTDKTGCLVDLKYMPNTCKLDKEIIRGEFDHISKKIINCVYIF